MMTNCVHVLGSSWRRVGAPFSSLSKSQPQYFGFPSSWVSREAGWGLVEEGLGLGPLLMATVFQGSPFWIMSPLESSIIFPFSTPVWPHSCPLSCSLPPTERTYLPGVFNINDTVEKPTSTSAQKANRDSVSFSQEDQHHHSIGTNIISSIPD